MGLPVRQRRVLERIESALRGSDPKLAALYAIFARLNRDEEMPRIEQLRHSAVIALGRVRRVPAALLGKLHIRLMPRQRAALFFPLALLLAVASIVYAAKSSSGDACTPVRQVASANATSPSPGTSRPAAGKNKLCRPPATVLTPLYIGK
jgi:hypothetical protein